MSSFCLSRKFNLELKGRIGRGTLSSQCGDLQCGEGHSNISFLGIVGYIRNGKQVLRPHYFSHFPYTEARANARLKFKNAMIAWSALSPSEKLSYTLNAFKIKPSLLGHNLFVKHYMEG